MNIFFSIRNRKKQNKQPIPKPVQSMNKNNMIKNKTRIVNNIEIGKKIIPESTVVLGNKVNINHYSTNNYSTFYPCNTSIIKLNDEYILNIRYVNYFINHVSQQDVVYNGYYNNSNKVFISINKYVKLDSNFQEIESKWLDINLKKVETMLNYRNKYLKNNSEIVVGIEDIRLYKFNSSVNFIGSLRVNPVTTSIAFGSYNYNNLNNFCVIKNNNLKYENTKNHLKSCEKNWSIVDFNNNMYIVYKWYPIQLCSVNDNNCIKLTKEINAPILFKKMRGSTCASKFNNNIWFLTHIVDHNFLKNGTGKYFHVFVIFDSNFNLTKYSQPFTFDNKLIEFCVGLIVEEKNIMMTYSIYDNSSVLGIYDRVKLINSLRWVCV